MSIFFIGGVPCKWCGALCIMQSPFTKSGTFINVHFLLQKKRHFVSFGSFSQFFFLIPTMSRSRLFLALTNVVQDRMAVSNLLVSQAAPAVPNVRALRRLPRLSPLYVFEFSVSETSMRRIRQYRRTAVNVRNLATQIGDSDTLFLRIRSRPQPAGTPEWDMGEANDELIQLFANLGIDLDQPADVDIFPRQTQDAPLITTSVLTLSLPNGAQGFSWQAVYDVLEENEYRNFSFLTADLVFRFPLRDLMRRGFRGGCSTSFRSSEVLTGMEFETRKKLLSIFHQKTDLAIYPWHYGDLSFAQRVAFGRSNARRKAEHLMRLLGLFYWDYTHVESELPPVCGVAALVMGLTAYRSRLHPEDTTLSTLLREYSHDVTNVYRDCMEYLHDCNIDPHEAQSFYGLKRILRLLETRCHFIIFDNTQKPIFWDYTDAFRGGNAKYNFKDGQTFGRDQLTLDIMDGFQARTVAIFFDQETSHYLPIFDLGLFLTKFTPKTVPQKRSASAAIEEALLETSRLGGYNEALGNSTSSINRYAMCYGCHTLISRSNARCQAHFCHRFMCKLCSKPFPDRQRFAMHLRPTSNGQCCPHCGSFCTNGKCYADHVQMCNQTSQLVSCPFCQTQVTVSGIRRHSCPTYECFTCKERVRDRFISDNPYHPNGYLQLHACPIPVKKPKQLGDGTAVYIFDFESMLYTDDGLMFPFLTPEQEIFMRDNNQMPPQFPVYVHIVNCASLCPMPTKPSDPVCCRTVFTIKDFWQEVCRVSQPYKQTYFYAHNMRGYDGRLLVDFLESADVVPKNMIEIGSKYLEVSFQNPYSSKSTIVFRDSLNHLQARLKDLPGMFGLDPAIVKKGYFPYLFNTPQNQNYRGAIPPRSMFGTESFSASALADFEQWYESRRGHEYDLKQEMVTYCENDVEVLARSLCAYRTVCLAYAPCDPLASITLAQHVFTLYKALYMPSQTLFYLDEYFATFARRALCGGNTNANCLYYSRETHPHIKGLHYYDIVSLYPTVQFFDPMPIGYPTTTIFATQRDSDDFLSRCETFFGFIELDVDTVDYNHHPIIPYRHQGKLLMTNFNHRRCVLTSPEFHYIRRHFSYRIKRVYRIDSYTPSTDVFKSFIQTWMKLKIISSKPPSNILTFLDKTKQHLGITIQPEEFKPNPALRSLAKLILNSLWGKFGERSNKRKCMFLSTGAARCDFFKKCREGTFKNTDMSLFGSTHIKARYHQVYQKETKNIAIAAFVTAHARLRFQEKCDAAGVLKFYGDTDSVIVGETIGSDGVSNLADLIQPGYQLGEWEPELGEGAVIQEFVALAPKTYAFRYQTPEGEIKEKVKAKGFSQSEHTKHSLNFDTYKRLLWTRLRPNDIDDPLHQSAVQTTAFKHISDQRTMITHDFYKTLQFCYEKGYIDPETFITYPYGSKRFFGEETTSRWVCLKEIHGNLDADTVMHDASEAGSVLERVS